MSIYLITYVSALIFGYILNLNREYFCAKRTVYVMFFFSCMFLIATLRAETVAADTSAYISIFRNIRSTPWKLLGDIFQYEKGYVVLNKIVSVLFSERVLLMLVSGVIYFGCAFVFLKESKNVYLSTILFMGFNHFFTSMSSLRQYIALIFLLLAYISFYNRRTIKSFFFMFLAFEFHQTSIIFSLCIIALMILGTCKKSLCGILLLESIIIFFYRPILLIFVKIFPKYSYYLTPYMFDNETGIGEIRLCFIILEILLIVLVLIKKELRTKKNIILSVLLSCGVSIGILQKNIPYIWRLTIYFDFILLLLIPEIIEGSKKHKIILYSIVNVLSISYFIYLLHNNLGVIPYKIYF